MKKRLSLVLLCGIVLLGLCGCGNNKNSSNENKNNSKITKYNYIGSFNDNILCSGLDLNDIIHINEKYVITSNKKYEINDEKLYSTTNENCKVIKTFNGKAIDYKWWGHSEGYELLQTDNGYKYQNWSNEVLNKNIEHYKSLGENVLFGLDLAIYDERAAGGGYGKDLISVDNDLKYIPYKDMKISNTIDIIESFDKNERVIFINNQIVKTNKAYYTISKYKTNKEDCEKYADIKCEYGYRLKKDKALTDNYDNIIVVSEYIVDKHGNIYKNS